MRRKKSSKNKRSPRSTRSPKRKGSTRRNHPLKVKGTTRAKRSYRKMSTKDKCKRYLQRKVSENLGLFKSGRYISRQQALAVSYKQAEKKYPRCRSVFIKRM